MRGWFAALGLVVLAFSLSGEAAERPDDLFESKIRPVLVNSCFPCHGAKKVSGGLRVDSLEALLKGGDTGPALVPNDPAASLLLKAMRHEKGVSPMPPKKPMDRAQAEAFAAWIRAGAKWPKATPAFVGERHWAFEPLGKETPPLASSSPVDAFLHRTLTKKGWTALGPADRRTLIRRATFDLTGLPPTPEEVEAFSADARPDAFARVVDRLLASPRYGERWGRHWLDVVRYADSAGETADYPLPHAWRYRNWVIDAVNYDQPYDEFIREQVAGDLLGSRGPPERAADRIVATGYLAIARRFGYDSQKDMHLTLEDTIDTLGKSVLGLTVACARCHTHKYDPITAEDYYALYGILASTKLSYPGSELDKRPRDLVPLPPSDEYDRVAKPIAKRIAELDARLERLQHERAKPKPAAPVEVLANGEFADGGSQSFAAGAKKAIEVKKGEMLQLSVSPGKDHGADSTLVEFDVRQVGGTGRWNLTRDVLADFPARNPQGEPALWCFLDARKGPTLLPESLRDHSGKPGLHVWRNGDTPSVFVNASDEPIKVWTTLAARSVFMHPAADGPVAIGWLSPITGTVRVEGRLADVHLGGRDGVAWSLGHVKADVGAALRKASESMKHLREATRERAALVTRLPAPPVAYAVAEGTIHDARVHLRGDPEKLGKEVPRRWLSLFGSQPVPPKAGSGRLQLAGWLTAADNPLTARVMVNRIWQHHFGKGLVKTPNDFGTRGQAPTHPELLDWLAADFVRSGWSVKQVHRRIMLSDAYQRAGDGPAPQAREGDPTNDSYWRFDRRRLSAEELRDALLVVGDTLDRSPGGGHPFPPEATWNFTQHAPFNTFYATNRRSVYLMVLRNRRHPFLGLFDGADPNTSTPERQVTTVPTQALYFMNDPFFHEQAAAFADRLLAQPDDSRVKAAFRLAYQRPPTPREQAGAQRFVSAYLSELGDIPAGDRQRQAWAAYARVLLGSNEFLYQD